MKKEMILPSSAARPAKFTCSLSLVLAVCLRWCARRLPVVCLSRCYSRLLGETVSPLCTLCLLNAQFAFLMLVCPLPFLFVVRMLFLLWFGFALLQCRHAFGSAHSYYKKEACTR